MLSLRFFNVSNNSHPLLLNIALFEKVQEHLLILNGKAGKFIQEIIQSKA
jgi:hypothetical protein